MRMWLSRCRGCTGQEIAKQRHAMQPQQPNAEFFAPSTKHTGNAEHPINIFFLGRYELEQSASIPTYLSNPELHIAAICRRFSFVLQWRSFTVFTERDSESILSHLIPLKIFPFLPVSFIKLPKQCGKSYTVLLGFLRHALLPHLSTLYS